MPAKMAETLLDEFGEELLKLSKGSEIHVTWNSARSDEKQDAEGEVLHMEMNTREQKLLFVRPDGQEMIIRKDLEIKSPGSHFPTTGYVTDIEALT